MTPQQRRRCIRAYVRVLGSGGLIGALFGSCCIDPWWTLAGALLALALAPLGMIAAAMGMRQQYYYSITPTQLGPDRWW